MEPHQHATATATTPPPPATSAAPPPSRAAWWRSDRFSTAAIAVVAVVAGLAVRWWQVNGRWPLWWQDSDDYLDVSLETLGSLDLWAGHRGPAVPLLLKATGGRPGDGFVAAQVVLAAATWAWLAAEVSRHLDTTRAWLAAGMVVTFSLTTSITLWDRSVLSESMGLSLLAAVTAAALGLLRRPSPGRVAVLLAAAAAWCTTRDSNAVIVLLAALLVMTTTWRWYRAERPARHRHLGAATAAGLVAIAGLSITSAAIGERDALPLADVFSVRILPYPDRLDWFAERGMPHADHFRRVVADLDPDHRRPVVWLPRDDPFYDPWWAWLRADGKATFARWLLTHPTYLVTEPLRTPERVFNNVGGDIENYAADDMPRVPVLTHVLWPHTAIAVIAAVSLGIHLLRHPTRRWSSLTLLGAAGVLVAAPSALITWHSGGMETARHLLLPDTVFRLGLLLTLIGRAGGRSAAWRGR